MVYSESVIELIKKRTSVRTYAKRPIEGSKFKAMSAFLDENTDNPFGAHVRFALINSKDAPKKPGTYGFIKGAGTYFAGCVKKGGRDMEGFGFAFEKAVLYATELGLGTCWLGGTFRKSAFIRAMEPNDEYLPAVSPLGYAADKKSVVEQAMAAGAGARNRKSQSKLFFDKMIGVPLDEPDGAVKMCLEMVRIGPSASNKQPWRIVRFDGKYHFYLKTNKMYTGNKLFGFCMQRIDMGIAACHFYLAARELGVDGDISFDGPLLLTNGDISTGLTYSFTWG
ncbi:MAG: nitroreductase family protein [Eubacteriales bacterium]|nr:nitroreductase family protein [Eubacteriales bacterium]